MNLDELFDSMFTRKSVLLAILKQCEGPTDADTIDALTQELQAHNASVYTGAAYTAILEEAGGLAAVDEHGAPYEDVALEPEVIEIDGVEYLEPAEPPAKYWMCTPAGRNALAAFDPAKQAAELLDEEPQYLPIYLRALEMGARESGAATASLKEAIDKDPLVQNPRKSAPRFTARLEQCQMMAWDGKVWRTTDEGRLLLERLHAAAPADETAAAAAADEATTESEA